MHILMSDLKAIIVWFFPTLNKAYCIVLRIKGHEADSVTTEIAQSKNLTTERRVEDIKGAIRILKVDISTAVCDNKFDKFK